jgi:DNA polymerase III sliding clamp (beta) subunit (PCNA family)
VAVLGSDLLRGAVEVVRRAMTEPRGRRPKVERIQITANERNGQLLEVEAGGAELAIRQTIDAGVKGRLSAWVAGEAFCGLTEGLGSELVSLRAGSGRLSVSTRSVKARFQMETGAGATASALEQEVGAPVRLPARRLREALRLCSWAAAAGGEVAALTGVFIGERGSAGLVVAGTDGPRLAMAPLGAGADGALGGGVIVPARALSAMAGVLSGGLDAELALVAGGGGVVLRSSGAVLYSRVIEGRFPAVERLVRRRFAARVTVRREHLTMGLRALERIGEAGGGRIDVVYRGGSHLALEARGGEVGAGRVVLDLESGEGGTVEVGLNQRFLAEAVDRLGGETVTLGLDGAESPVTVLRTGPDGALVMIAPLH